MKEILRNIFGILVFLVLVAVIGRIFFFNFAQTNSYSMIPTLVPGDTFLVLTRWTLGPGDIAVCRNPENPRTMIVSRILGVPGSTFGISNNGPIINGRTLQHEYTHKSVYVDDTSGEHLEFLVDVAYEYLGGREFQVAMMTRAGERNFRVREVETGFFLVGDNRNRARDSRHFGEVPVSSCIGKAILVLWPGEDSGDLKQKSRIFDWLD